MEQLCGCPARVIGLVSLFHLYPGRIIPIIAFESFL